MKKGLTRITLVAGVAALCLIIIAQGCPLQMFTPGEIANILLQPTRDEITALKLDLVNGVITVDQWELQMFAIKVRLGWERVVLETIRDSGMSYQRKIETLLQVYPWNIRGGI